MMMNPEIGGYLELEEFTGREYYDTLHRVNLGRTALLWLAESRAVKKLLVPWFLCDSVTKACASHGIALEGYGLDETLSPLLSLEDSTPKGVLEEGTALYLVNYYGQLQDRQILAFRQQYGRIIVDHTQAFFQRPLPGVDTLYSCRKFFGVSDGAYLSTDAALTPCAIQDHSHERMTHILGRYETDAQTFYQQMLNNADTYHQMEIRQMSRLTQNLLRAVDYERARQRRGENYRLLKELLPSENPFTRILPEGPFAYPYYHPEGIRLRRRLAARQIFVPTNWSNVLKSRPADSLEYQWAANILPLPCDQRYGREEMQRMAAIIRQEETRL